MRGHGTLIERSGELDELDGWIARARAGHGGLVLVGGEAGVGKTVLVRASIERSDVRSYCVEATKETTEPYAPIVSLLRTQLRSDETPFEEIGPLAAHLSLLLPELGPPPETSPAALADALAAWFDALGTLAPAAVFFDDLQWADTATLEVLPRLALELESARVLLIGAYRSDEVTRLHPVRRLRVHLRRAGRLRQANVEPLGPAATAELAGRMLGEALAPSLARVVYDRTEGVPFFVEELVAALSSEGGLTPGDGGLELAAGRNVPLPDSVRDAVLVRLEALSETSRSCLQLASVVGLRFDLELIEALAGHVDLTEPVALGLVVEPEPGAAAFRHALTREAVYADAPWSRRQELHRRVAECLERRGAPPGVLAEHWLACRELDLARHAFVAAAERSCVVHAYREAAKAYRHALELWPDDDISGRLDAVDRLARCAQLSGELIEAARLWEEVAAALDPDDERARFADVKRQLAAVYRLLGRRDHAALARAEAAEALTACESFAAAAEERLRLVWDLEGDPDDPVFGVLDDADRDAVLAGRLDLTARANGLRAHMLARRGRFDEATELAREAVELARSTGVTSALFDAYWYLAAVGVTRADYEGAHGALEAAAEVCRASGLSAEEHFCVACLSKIMMKRGEWDRAYALAADVLASGDQAPLMRWHALWATGVVDVARGRTDRGRPLLVEAMTFGASFDFPPARIEGMYGLALADEIDGASNAAADRYRELIGDARAHARDVQEAHHYSPTLRWAVGFFAARQDGEQVRACADVLADVAAGFGSPDALAALAHALGEASLLEGDAAQASNEFTRAVALLEEAEMPFEAAVTKLRAGRAFAAAGEHETGVDHVVDAYRCFRTLGARPFWVRAAAQLEELGERVDRRVGRRAAGDLERGGLTRRELEVLRLVAVGRTNREIAHELFLSHRTIDMHVSHLLGKLGCRSRTQATTTALQLGLL